jgi:hypothetical protein
LVQCTPAYPREDTQAADIRKTGGFRYKYQEDGKDYSKIWKYLLLLRSERKNYARQTTSYTMVASPHQRRHKGGHPCTADWARPGEYRV